MGVQHHWAHVGGVLILDSRGMVDGVAVDVGGNTDIGVISARFHNWAADGMVGFAMKGREKTGITTVCMSGGVFCNRYLSNRVIRLLKANDFCVLFNREIPVNDGGIAAGQAAIAAASLDIA